MVHRATWIRAIVILVTAVGLLSTGYVGARAASTHAKTKFNIAPYKAAVAAHTSRAKWHGPYKKVTPPKNVFAVIVSCTEALEGCRLNTLGDQEGVKALGWRNQTINVTDPAKYGNAMQTALNEHANIIFLVGVDEAVVGNQIAAAHKRHIPVVSTTQYNKAGCGARCVDVEVSPNGTLEGKLIADQMIVNQNGHVDAQFLADPEFGLPVATLAGARKELATCQPCKVEPDVYFTANDIATRLPDLVVSTLRSRPNVNSLLVGYDPPVTFIAPAIDHANMSGHVKLYSQIGTSAALNFIRKRDVLAADISFPIEWAGWAGVDEGVRLLKHQPLVVEPLPVKLINSSDVPKTGSFVGDSVPYKQNFRKLWGLR
jgi:ABC-type sugar transport system substrate-binding protein